MNGTDISGPPANDLFGSTTLTNRVFAGIFSGIVACIAFGIWLTFRMRRRDQEAAAQSNDVQVVEPAQTFEPLQMEPIEQPAPMATSYEASRISQPPLITVVAVVTPVPPSTPRLTSAHPQ